MRVKLASSRLSLRRISLAVSSGCAWGWSAQTSNAGSPARRANSSASNNQRNGFEAVAQFGATSQLDLENVSSSNNGNAGVLAEGSGAVIRLSNTTIDHNGGAGVVPLSGGLILSFGNNKFSANAAGDGTINGPAVPK